jgi:hypothetical protein
MVPVTELTVTLLIRWPPTGTIPLPQLPNKPLFYNIRYFRIFDDWKHPVGHPHFWCRAAATA